MLVDGSFVAFYDASYIYFYKFGTTLVGSKANTSNNVPIAMTNNASGNYAVLTNGSVFNLQTATTTGTIPSGKIPTGAGLFSYANGYFYSCGYPTYYGTTPEGLTQTVSTASRVFYYNGYYYFFGLTSTTNFNPSQNIYRSASPDLSSPSSVYSLPYGGLVDLI